MPEEIMKSLDTFEKGVLLLKDALKTGEAKIAVSYGKFNLSVEIGDEKFAGFPPEELKPALDEISHLMLVLLRRQEPQIIEAAGKQGEEAQRLLLAKIEVLKKHIITNEMQRKFDFYSNCSSNVLEIATVHKVLRPNVDGNNIDSVVIKLVVKDNLTEQKTPIQFEMLPEELMRLLDNFRRILSS